MKRVNGTGRRSARRRALIRRRRGGRGSLLLAQVEGERGAQMSAGEERLPDPEVVGRVPYSIPDSCFLLPSVLKI